MSFVTLGRAAFLGLCLCLYYNAVSGLGPTSPASPQTDYNPENRSSKNISSCE